jgi:CBS domain-containing membrane protein
LNKWLKAVAAALALQPHLLRGRERWRVALGALIGVFLAGLGTALLAPSDNVLPVLIAPMAASAVLLFVLPASPLAQPWSVVGGNVISAAIGVACAQWITPPLLASAVAVTAAIAAMLMLRCVHPPGGAMALSAVLGGPILQAGGFEILWSPVAVNSILMVLVAMLFHRATGHRYPHSHHHPVTPRIRASGIIADDIAAALRESDEILDVDVEDLLELLDRAEQQAVQRVARLSKKR